MSSPGVREERWLLGLLLLVGGGLALLGLLLAGNLLSARQLLLLLGLPGLLPLAEWLHGLVEHRGAQWLQRLGAGLGLLLLAAGLGLRLRRQLRVPLAARHTGWWLGLGMLGLTSGLLIAASLLAVLQGGQLRRLAYAGYDLVVNVTRPWLEGDRHISGLRSYSGLTIRHTTTGVVYETVPPVGGDHSFAWQNCGIYDRPIAAETAVHSMQHGALWLTYRPELADDQVEQLRGLVRRYRSLILSPYPALPQPIVISGWGYQLMVERADDPRLALFIDRFLLVARGPEPLGVEPGGPCQAGVGSPLP
jgi:hypothetical protein